MSPGTLDDELNAEPADHRRALVEALREWRDNPGNPDVSFSPLSPAVLEAIETVPRHLFVPGTPLGEAHDAFTAVITKRSPDGTALSSVSAPSIVAMMLTQLDVRPGHRILEIGSGGYNAALLQHLAGPAGHVVSIDIDADVVDRARACLTAAGYPDIDVRQADGEHGLPDAAPFDRINVTVQAPDIPPAWTAQLTDRGRLVVPLTLRGISRSYAFTHRDGVLHCDAYEICGFVPMQGDGAADLPTAVLADGQVTLRLMPGQHADPAALDGALGQPRSEVWTGVQPGVSIPFGEHLDLWLATTMPGFCLITATPEAVESGLVDPTLAGFGTPGITDGASFAYRTWRRVDGPGGAELGVYGHGPRAAGLAHQLAAYHRAWEREHKTRVPARITVHPADTPTGQLPAGFRVDTRHTRTVVAWP